MIRINLLGTPRAKGKRGSAATAGPSLEIGDVGSPTIKVLVAIALLAGANGFYWYYLDHQAKEIATKMQVAQDHNRQLSVVKAKYLERQKQADNYKRRVDVIDQLRAAQNGYPTNLLNTIGDTINGTEAVWLSSMKDQGTNVAIQGMALSTYSVATSSETLQKTGYFKNIEIKETYQDESVKDMQAFQFELTCEKGSQKGKS